MRADPQITFRLRAVAHQNYSDELTRLMRSAADEIDALREIERMSSRVRAASLEEAATIADRHAALNHQMASEGDNPLRHTIGDSCAKMSERIAVAIRAARNSPTPEPVSGGNTGEKNDG